MIPESAPEAKVMAAIADDCWDDSIKITLFHAAINSVDAVWSWTPLKIFLVVDVRARE